MKKIFTLVLLLFCKHAIASSLDTLYLSKNLDVVQDVSEANRKGIKTELPEKIAFIFGNEKDGLQSDFLELSDKVIELPACGMKNSLNVANAFSATIYEYFRRYGDNLLNG